MTPRFQRSPTGVSQPVQPTHEQTYKSAVRDAVFYLLRRAAEEPGRGAICHLAQAMQQLFLEGSIDVVWALVDRKAGTRVRAQGASCSRPGQRAVPMSPEGIEAMLAPLPPIEPTVHRVVRAHGLETEDRWFFVIVRRPPGCLLDLDERLWISLPIEPRKPEMQQRREWMLDYLQGQQELVDALRALQTIDRHAALERRVDALTWTGGDRPLEQRLQEASRLLKSIIYEIGCDDPQQHYLALAERLGHRFVKVTLGSGYLVHATNRRYAHEARDVARGLFRAAAIGDAQPAHTVQLSTRLRLLAMTLRRQTDTSDSVGPELAAWREALDTLADDANLQGHEAAWLLAVWAGVHRTCVASDAHVCPEEHAHLWAWAARRTPEMVQRMLGGSSCELSRNTLALWFSSKLLTAATSGTVRPPERRHRLQTSVAWVLREATRQFLYADHADFIWQPERFADAMLDLVEVHAHDLLELPHPLDVRGTIMSLTTTRGQDPSVAAAHRQHVLEIYLAAQFFLDVQKDDGTSLVAVDQLLSDDASPQDLRRTVALACLHHAIGIVLLHRLPATDPWAAELPLPRDVLETLRNKRHEGRSAFLQRCTADLVDSDLVGALPPQSHDGAHTHGVVSAWILLHLGRAAHIDTHVLGPALRAILLHATRTLDIQVSRDPAATLLVLCNQLFAWDPHTELLPRPHEVSDNERILSTPHDPRASRAQRIVASDITLHCAEGTLYAVARPRGHWPSIRVELRHPDLSGVPTWQTWLSIAQALGRVHSDTDRWAPSIHLVSPVPRWLLERDLDTRRLLEQVAWTPDESVRPIAMSLRDWLGAEALFHRRDARESMALHPLRYHDDVRTTFANLQTALEGVLARTSG